MTEENMTENKISVGSYTKDPTDILFSVMFSKIYTILQSVVDCKHPHRISIQGLLLFIMNRESES